MNKIIGFVIFLLVISGIYYFYQTLSYYQSELAKCSLTKNDNILMVANERDNFVLRINTCESKLLAVIREEDTYKNQVNECDGKIEAAKRTCVGATVNYNSLLNQLRLCTSSSSTTTTIVTSTTIAKINNTTILK